MDIAIYSTKEYEKKYLTQANKKHNLHFIDEMLSIETVNMAKGYPGICCFVTDILDKTIIEKLAMLGVKLITLRSAGYDHVALDVATSLGVTVVNVPQYSPEAVAEFAVALLLSLNRKILTAYQHGIDNNFSLDGLMGFNLNNKTVGIIGTGKIGTAFAKIMHGFGCQLLAYDPIQNDICLSLRVNYAPLKEVLSNSDIVSLHCPLTKQNHHMLSENEFNQFRSDAILINTARGALINTAALINALENKKISAVALDVYENERGLFFIDHHKKMISDILFEKLRKFPNVLITPHQAFFTQEALINISKTTIDNINAFESGKPINLVI
jgi:D-lactate dehydrogenase